MWPRIRRFVRKLSLQFGRERVRRELAEEIAAHEAFKIDEHASAGLDPGEAARRARLEMGNMALAADRSADVRAFLPLEDFVHDVRFSLRLLRKDLAFSLMAILSLALGIGGATAVFSILNALLIKPLPFGDPARLVRITEFYPKALLAYFSERSRTMDIASASPGVEVNVTGEGPAFRVSASPVSANLFSVLRAPVQIGRSFENGEDQPGRDRVAMLSYDLWTQRFGSDPAVIGRLVAIDGVARRIVGVMPRGFAFPSARVQLWIPAPVDPTRQADYWAGEFTPLIGRLRPQASIAHARQEVSALASGVWRMFPWPMPRNWNANATAIPLQTDLAGDTRGRLLALLCSVGAVLVVACANVAGLLTARGAVRRKELAVRAALGAGRRRIVRQLLTESVVLAAGAGGVGLTLGAFGLRLFRSVVPPDLAGAARIGIDWRVACFAAALALVAGLSFGTAPAVAASRLDLVQAVKTGSGRFATTGSTRFRSWLIGGEIALTLMLVVGAALLVRSLFALSTADPGFLPQRVLAVKISPDSSFCKQPERCIAFYDNLRREARGVTGIVDAAVVNDVPLDGSASSLAVDVEDHPKTAEFPAPMFWAGAISPEYLRVMRIPLLSGRSFTEADSPDSEPVVMIDAVTAARFWPGRSAIGKHVKSASERRWRTVVGVVGAVRQFNLANRVPSGITGAMYMPYAQSVGQNGRTPEVMNLVVKTGAYTPRVAGEIHRFAASVNPNIPVGQVVSADAVLGESLSGFRSTTWLFLSFASVALALAAVGVYGLVSYSVAQRSYEIALRMSIGATSGSILGMILGKTIRVAAVGLAIGVAGALAVARGLSALLFDGAGSGPAVYAFVAAFMLIVAVAASLVPALRAARIDPVRALRAE